MTQRRNLKVESEAKALNDAAWNNFTIDLVKEIGVKNLVHNDNMPRLRRQFSIHELEKYWKKPATSAKGRRSFVRFWAMVEPVAWFAN